MRTGFCRACGKTDGHDNGIGTLPTSVCGGLCLTCWVCFLHWAKDWKQPGRASRLFEVRAPTPGIVRSVERWLRVFEPSLTNKVNDFMEQLTSKGESP